MKYSDYNYREYENDLSAINRNASVSPESFIRQVEKEYRESLEQAACFLERRTGDIRIVMLAGPSSSGKTTTARNLMEILRTYGRFVGNGLSPRPTLLSAKGLFLINLN